MVNFVTVIPPTQEDAVLGSRKNAVRVRNIAQRVNSLCFSLRSLLFHTVHSKSDNCPAALLSFSLISHFSLTPYPGIYMWLNLNRQLVSTLTHTPNLIR